MSDMDPKEFHNELARLAGRVAHVEDKTEHIDEDVKEIKRDVKTLLADINKARGVAGVLAFLAMAIPAGIATLLTWLLTRH